MGKVKAKKRGLSDYATRKAALPKKKVNPFEMHINHQKFDVIGRKSKSDRGLPGISRSKAMKKRKATLLQEYKVKDKSNKFFDRRIGEKNREMTYEDKVVARFTAERMKMFKKKQIYNLADDEILTHRGQTLSEIERFDDPRSDEDDDDLDDPGKLDASFVEGAHFGGGAPQKSDGDKKSRKDLIEQLIAESKKRKAEKQRTREQAVELTAKLDTEWQDLLPLMSLTKKKTTDIVEIEKPDSYDTMMRELKFEARGRASDPLKTEVEIEEEERKRRAHLEAEREKRMLANVERNELLHKHRSADDLDDGFEFDEESEVTLTYDLEGNMQLDRLRENLEIQKDSQSFTSKTESFKQNESDEMQHGSDSDNSDNQDDCDETEEDEETDDSLSDLKPSVESEVEIESKTTSRTDLEEKNKLITTVNKPSAVIPKISENEKQKFLLKVRERNPNFPCVPDNYETLQKLLRFHDAGKQEIIISHIMEKNQVSLNEMNRTRLVALFSFLLKHISDTSLECADEGFKVLNCLAPLLFDLVHISPENTAQQVLDILKEKQEEFQKHQQKYPTFNTLIFFKLISLLFPTSDFRHPVVTPSLVFISQMLFQCRIRNRKDISAGLFLVTMLLEFTVLSKRYSPSAINFLCGILYLAIPKRTNGMQNIMAVPPFRKIGNYSELLVLESKCDEECLKMKASDLSEEIIDTSFKIRAVSTALSMFNEFVFNLGNLPACPFIFYHASQLLSKLPLENYPSQVHSEIQKLTESLDKLRNKTVQYLVIERKRPKALRLYEPSIQEVFDGKRRRPMGERKMEREKLLHKIKREKKAAIREIRRDNSFLTKLKRKETEQSDMERMQKVKEIFGAASAQLGEIRALERKKKHAK